MNEEIRVRVRTGTSTRPPEYMTEEEHRHSWFSVRPWRIRDTRTSQESFIPMTFELIQNEDSALALFHIGSVQDMSGDLVDGGDLDRIVARSLADTELKRNHNIKISLRPRNCEPSETTDICTVCQSCLSRKVTTTECQHTFHYPCIAEWVKYKPSCPVCRHPIPVLEK